MVGADWLPERYQRKIAVCESGCWEWLPAQRQGYGRAGRNGRHIYAHRLVYELAHGSIPDGFHVDHLL